MVVGLAWVLAAGLTATGVSARQGATGTSGILETRAELEALLEDLRSTATSTAYSSSLRRRARDQAAIIERRLREGDFGTNDRIFASISVQGQVWFQDTLRVRRGTSIQFPEIGAIDLAGVLRSELAEHLRAELSTYIRDPRVDQVSTFIRLQVSGAVALQGERYLAADLNFGEALAQAGLGPTADPDAVEVLRGEETLMDSDAVAEARQEGLTLDQMSLQAGDEIRIAPRDPPTQVWGTVLRWGAIVASSLLLGVRIF